MLMMLLPTTIQHASEGDAFQTKADQRTFAPQYPAIPTSIRYNQDHGKTVSSTIYPPLYLKIDMQTPSKSTSSRSFPRDSHRFPEPKWSLWKVDKTPVPGPHAMIQGTWSAGKHENPRWPSALPAGLGIPRHRHRHRCRRWNNPAESTNTGVWGSCSLGMTNKIHDSCMDNNDNHPNKIGIWMIYIYNIYIYICKYG